MRNFSKMNIFRDLTISPPTLSGTSSSDGKLDEDNGDVDTTDECDSKGNKDEAIQVDEPDPRAKEEEKERQRKKIDVWERTLPGSGKLLFWWYILVSMKTRSLKITLIARFYLACVLISMYHYMYCGLV